MALTATADRDSFAASPSRSAPPHGLGDRLRCAAARAVLAAGLFAGLAATAAVAGEAPLAAAPVAADDERSVTIILKSPNRMVEGERVTLQSMLRFSGRAWEDARIEILANGVVVSRTTARRGGLWYAPGTEIAAGDYEFAARAVAPDGTRETSDVLRVTVSPPILLDPETLAGKSVYSVGSLAPAVPETAGRTG